MMNRKFGMITQEDYKTDKRQIRLNEETDANRQGEKKYQLTRGRESRVASCRIIHSKKSRVKEKVVRWQLEVGQEI